MAGRKSADSRSATPVLVPHANGSQGTGHPCPTHDLRIDDVCRGNSGWPGAQVAMGAGGQALRAPRGMSKLRVAGNRR